MRALYAVGYNETFARFKFLFQQGVQNSPKTRVYLYRFRFSLIFRLARTNTFACKGLIIDENRRI